MTTQQGSRYEGTTTKVGLDNWTAYASILVKYLGLTELNDITDLKSIDQKVRDDEQRLQFSVTRGERKSKIIVSYSLKPNTDKISLHYCVDTVF